MLVNMHIDIDREIDECIIYHVSKFYIMFIFVCKWIDGMVMVKMGFKGVR